MAKELPSNIEALQGIEFEEVKKTASNIKRINDLINKSIEKNDFKMLEDVKKQTDMALKHLENFCETLNKEREITTDVKDKAKSILKQV